MKIPSFSTKTVGKIIFHTYSEGLRKRLTELPKTFTIGVAKELYKEK